jgi:hypothetical protein
MTESVDGRESRFMTGPYGNPWLTGGRGGMPRGCGLEAGLGLELPPSNPPRYLDGGLGEVAEETEEES